MKKIYIVLICLISFVFGLEAQKKKDVSNVQMTLSYSLPKVVYKVEVEAECEYKIMGPYASKAEEVLGIIPETIENSRSWKISSIQVSPVYKKDLSYSMTCAYDYSALNINLSPEGFLAGLTSEFNPIVDNGTKNISMVEFFEDFENEKLDVKDVLYYNSVKEVLDSNYTTQIIDGEEKKIWDPIVRYELKNDEDNYKEVVAEIRRIRADRQAILNFDRELSDGESYKAVLESLDKREKSYLELFLGRIEKRKIKRVFYCELTNDAKRVTAFRFSGKNGFVNDASGVPCVICAENINIADKVVNFKNTSASDVNAGEKNGIYYRQPASADINVMFANKLVYSFYGILPQLGNTVCIPFEVISVERLNLEFYPQYGSLKRIYKK